MNWIIFLIQYTIYIYIFTLWYYNNYADVHFQSSREYVALEVTVSSVKSTDVTCKIHSGQLAAQLPWLVNLVSVVEFSVTGSISSMKGHDMHCWWDLRSKQLTKVSVCHARVFTGFLVIVIQIFISLRINTISVGSKYLKHSWWLIHDFNWQKFVFWRSWKGTISHFYCGFWLFILFAVIQILSSPKYFKI